jgi:2-succinyl-5-enolpyruvyl-6-hydroxy-3-cyclohexene-1-carboxylate synthase
VSSQSIASRVVATLNANGVSDFLLSPGSRSQGLAIAAKQLEDSSLARLTVRLDERSMAFTGLGIAQAKKKPVALIVTSGTAVANLFPAVLEAYHSSVPLILLTADRPARLRGKGANQTTNQVDIFGFAAKCFDIPIDVTESDAEAVVLQALTQVALEGKPVQINIQFDLPLSASSPKATDLVATSRKIKNVERSVTELAVPVDNHTVVVAGAGGERASEFAHAANLPLLAEPSSGARHGKSAVVNYLTDLEQLKDEVRKVVVFGKPTLSRATQKLISEAAVYSEVSRYGRFDPFENVIASADKLIPEGRADDSWLAKWNSKPETRAREEFVQFVWRNSERLVLGASDLIRVLDSAAEAKELEVFSNRGLAGIDGTVSTAIGIAIASGKTTALIGDLTLLHDAGGLNKTDLPELELRLVVGNDRGGHIFSRLEVAKEIDGKSFERLFNTGQRVDIEALAKAYGWTYARCTSLSDLAKAWELPGTVIIDYELVD